MRKLEKFEKSIFSKELTNEEISCVKGGNSSSVFSTTLTKCSGTASTQSHDCGDTDNNDIDDCNTGLVLRR